jgi:hypothetical protein
VSHLDGNRQRLAVALNPELRLRAGLASEPQPDLTHGEHRQAELAIATDGSKQRGEALRQVEIGVSIVEPGVHALAGSVGERDTNLEDDAVVIERDGRGDGGRGAGGGRAGASAAPVKMRAKRVVVSRIRKL